MDLDRVQQLRDELLANPRYRIMAGAITAAFLLVTVIGGVLLFRQALDDNRPITASVLNVPTRIGLLFSYDEPQQVVNHIVFFNDVRLESGPSDDLYYAVGAAGKKVLVMSQGAKNSSGGDLVDVRGTVRILPSTYTLKKKWKLTKEEIKAAQEQGIYIEADQITARRPTTSKMAKK